MFTAYYFFFFRWDKEMFAAYFICHQGFICHDIDFHNANQKVTKRINQTKSKKTLSNIHFKLKIPFQKKTGCFYPLKEKWIRIYDRTVNSFNPYKKKVPYTHVPTFSYGAGGV